MLGIFVEQEDGYGNVTLLAKVAGQLANFGDNDHKKVDKHTFISYLNISTCTFSPGGWMDGLYHYIQYVHMDMIFSRQIEYLPFLCTFIT